MRMVNRNLPIGRLAATLLPLVVQQLTLGKGRGKSFVSEQVSRVRRAPDEKAAKAILRTVICQNFFAELLGPSDVAPPSEIAPETPADASSSSGVGERRARASKHLEKVVAWLHATILMRGPWSSWTNDVYDALRCIDHLPIS